MDNVTLTNSTDMVTVTNNTTSPESYFGFNINPITNTMEMIEETNENIDIDEQITLTVDKEVNKNKNILEQIKTNNKTRLSDSQLLDLYSDFDNNPGFVIF